MILIKQTLAIHDGEERPLCLLLIYAFFMGVTLASFFAASGGLFLSVYSSNTLSYVYITAAIVSSLTGGVYALFKRYLSLSGLLYLTQIFLLISVLAFYIGLQSIHINRAAYRFGIRTGMRVRPVVLLIGTLSLVVVGLLNETTALLFYLAAGTKLCDLVLLRSFNMPSLLLLYQPLNPDQKLKTQLSVETMISPIAGGVAGLALLGLNL